jgi:EAL domain-containing protein (putative c-di-GMP-specific phosphodiesterase class I)
VQLVARALKETGLPASLLTLEITESTAMQQTDVTLGTLRRLKELGVSIAIDDFGTGYSSFSYLKLFPVNSLKIDRSFISEVERDGDNRAIVAAIIALAQVLGLKVVAEGVETEAQKQFLRGFGCEQVQGYLTGKPVDADSAAKDFL